jgi:TPR repeat protein
MDDPVALLDAIETSFARGDREAVKTGAARLEQLAQGSAGAAYVASKAFEHGACLFVFGIDTAHAKRKQYLSRAAELGNPMAQIELAANHAYGTNGYEENIEEFQKWIGLAAKHEPIEAARCYAEVAEAKGIAIPHWATKALRP